MASSPRFTDKRAVHPPVLPASRARAMAAFMAEQAQSGADMGAQYDVLVIGSGAAGLTAALELATRLKVLVLAKGSLTGGSIGR